MAALDVVLILLAIPALVATGYLALLTAMSGRSDPPAHPPPRLRFDVVVPAHDEEAGIARTVRSLLALDWPRELFRVRVVADNCTDATAARAAEAGAEVLVRTDLARRGKGYALELAFARVLSDGFADAAVVVDADTLATANLLGAFAARLEAGALAVQSGNTVLNAEASWRTRLMKLAFTLFNDLRSRGRQRLGVSCGLRGNGLCVSRAALLRVPHDSFSIVEDLEYGIRLGEAGIRVAYAPEARVESVMVSGADASRTQRQRWEGGRRALSRQHAARLLAQAVRRRDKVLLDLAMDLLVPPLSRVAAYACLGAAAVALLALAHLVPPAVLALWLVPVAFLACYVLRGVQLSGMGWRGLLALAWAPAFLAWKLALLVRLPRRRKEWVRTAREKETEPTAAP